MQVSKDFEEFFELLNLNSVRYLIVGGYAYAIYAEPRYTKDLDIFYERDKINADKLLTLTCVEKFGFDSLKLTPEDFTKSGRVIQIGYPPLRIDLINEIDGVTFNEAWRN